MGIKLMNRFLQQIDKALIFKFYLNMHFIVHKNDESCVGFLGKVAWSEVQDGGWLIMGLYKVLMQYVDNRHKIRLIRAITRINHLIALTMHTITNDPSLNFMKCMPVMSHTLERDIVFVPRNIQWNLYLYLPFLLSYL